MKNVQSAESDDEKCTYRGSNCCEIKFRPICMSGHISGISQTYLMHITGTYLKHLRGISVNSRADLKHIVRLISGISYATHRKILSTSHAYLWCNSGTYPAHLRHIQGESQAIFLMHISCKFQAIKRNFSAKSKANPRQIEDTSQAY